MIQPDTDPPTADKTLQQVATSMCCAHGASTFERASTESGPAQVIHNLTSGLQGSRRVRLWELPTDLHCSVIGVCLPIDALRRLVAKHYGGPCIVGDYEVHSVVVHACKSRTPLVELVQRELERCYLAQVKQFQLAKSDTAVNAMWVSASADGPSTGGLAGALWASLTHPRTDDVLRTKIGHDIHMIQHQVGAQARRSAMELTQARQLNAECVADLETTRKRLSQLQALHAHEAQAKQQQLAEAHTALLGLKAQNEALASQMQSLRQSVAGLDAREKLSERVDALTAQNIRLKEQLREKLKEQPSDFIERKANAANRLQSQSDAQSPQTTSVAVAQAAIRAIDLQQKSVLCVGGRSSAVALYRDAVERAGGKFIHHDGGIEHNHHRLDANLAAADCVVCQTGHISHTAYWLVKNYCKKTGKRCVYLDRASVSTFVEGLSALPVALCSKAKVNTV